LFGYHKRKEDDARTGKKTLARHVSMGWLSLFALAVALAMDALAVAVVTGLTLNQLTPGHVLRMSLNFGLFQAVMPVLGWAAGLAVHRYISEIDHWVAFALLAVVGGRMVWGSFCDGQEKVLTGDPTTGFQLLMLSVATSIDALAVGLSLAMVQSPILVPALVIGAITAGLTAVGMLLGSRIGALWGKRVEALGGLILIAIGIDILCRHMAS
jgi:manganese efflux pump family protein